jgi:hypothetical protein
MEKIPEKQSENRKNSDKMPLKMERFPNFGHKMT